MQLGAARRRLLEQDRVARQALGERGEHVAGAQRLAGGGRRGRRGALRAARRRARARVDRLGERRADRGRVAEHGELDRAAVRLLRVLRDDRDPRARRRTSGPASYGYWRSAPVPTTSTASCGREHLAQPRAARRAGGRRTADGPAGSRPAPPNGSWKTGHAEPLGERDQRRPAGRRRRRRRRRRSPARSAPSSSVGERVDGAGVGRRGAQQPRRARASRAARARARASRPSARSRSPGPRPVAASW